MKRKTIRRTITIIIIAVLVCTVAVGAFFALKKFSRGTVNVYPAGSFIMEEYWGDSTEMYGNVTMEDLQKVYCSSTQTVVAVHVQEGDEVKTGDILVEFDTTLTQIDMEKAQLEVSELEIEYNKANKELEEIKNMSPHYEYLVVPETKDVEFIPQETPKVVSGKGTMDDPLYILYDEDEFDDEFIESLFAKVYGREEETTTGSSDDKETTTASEDIDGAEESGDEESSEETTEEETTKAKKDSDKSIYAAFVTRYENALNGEILSSWGLCITQKDGGYTYRQYDPILSEEIEAYDEAEGEEPYYEEGGSDYTSAEIAQMRSEKEEEIADIESDYKLALVELKKVENEVNESTVYSKIDGVVKKVRDEDESRNDGSAMIEVSAGGGYYINASMSEMELLEVGQSVTVSSWESGDSAEGEVVKVDTYPSEESDGYTSGNTNVSYYPFTVFVPEDANFEEDSYVSISYSADEEEDSIYIDKMFVLNENGKNYVYVADDEGVLRRRQLRTGKTLWGSYIQIYEGISSEDLIAFPYGNDVADGAKTKEADVSELYSY